MIKASSFGIRDQTAFASLSGDYNPLHLDPIAARRTMFGRIVVHGIHAVLRALDTWMAEAPPRGRLTYLRATFPRAIGLDEAIDYVVDSASATDAEIRLSVRGSDVVVLKAGRTPASTGTPVVVPSGDPAPAPCREMTRDDIPRASGTLPLVVRPESVARLFPRMAASVPAHQVAAILATTRLVGMECPGLHSVFAGLALVFGEATGTVPELAYRVTSYQAPLSRIGLEVRGPGCSGTITAFVRPGPAVQASCVALRSLVDASEFAGQRALIVGGSRGLGEVVAKILAAGGASVRVTYHRGAADAERVVEEIRRTGGAADCAALDVLDPADAPALRTADTWAPTHLYYFATPPIFVGGAGVVSPALLASFRAYYVTGFRETVERVRGIASTLRGVFYPSSIALDETPTGMAEYAMAKREGERAAEALSTTYSGLVVTTPRLPRLATDQTATFLPVATQDSAPALLHHLRDLSRRTTNAASGRHP